VEQGLLKTFGRVMPVLMTLCSVIGVSYLVYVWPLGASEQLLAALSAISFGAPIVSTIIFNVPINLATGKWLADVMGPLEEMSAIMAKGRSPIH
jgi:hypothetical protein